MKLYSPNPTYRLKLIEAADLEDLRAWKNANRQFFFYKEEISPEQQQVWFAKYQERPADFMFVVQQKQGDTYVNVGCMGYRLEQNEQGQTVVDLYNIMRGRQLEEIPSWKMSEAFRLMCAFVAQNYTAPMECQVLTENPARQWYEALGMVLQETRSDHVLYAMPKEKVAHIVIEKVEK